MRERLKFLIDPKNAPDVGCPPDIGRPAGLFRIVIASPGDKAFELLRHCEEKWVSANQPGHFAGGWSCRRLYSQGELDVAELFQLVTRGLDSEAMSDPSVYDTASACVHCGAGRRQITDLVIDQVRLPKQRQVVRTIGREWLVQKDLAESLSREGFTGFRFRPVAHRRERSDMPIVPQKYPAGRKILEQASTRGGLPLAGFESKYPDLWPQLLAEHKEAVHRAEARSPHRPSTEWMQLEITSKPIPICSKTQFGINYFDRDQAGRYRCPLGHSGGLHLLSEVWAQRVGWDGTDIVASATLYGHHRGPRGPQPALLVSPRLYQFLYAQSVKGIAFEVAHLV
jgi:hypothetical protein